LGPGYGCLFILDLDKGYNVYIARGIDELHTLTAQFVGHPGIDIIGHQQPFVGHLLDLIDQGAEVCVLCPLLYLDCECVASRNEPHDCIDHVAGYLHILVLGMQAQPRHLRDSLDGMLKNLSFSAFFSESFHPKYKYVLPDNSFFLIFLIFF